MKNLFFTSERGCDASDKLLCEILKSISCTVGGYRVKITKDPLNQNVRIFDLTSLYDGEEGNIFFRKDDSQCISKLHKEVFETKGVEILRKSFENREILIMDEIGFLESRAEKFTGEVFKILDSDKVVFGLIKGRDCEYINRICSREDTIILKVTEENAAEVKHKTIEILKKWGVPFF